MPRHIRRRCGSDFNVQAPQQDQVESSRDGVVTAAFGSRQYLEFAIDLALSVHAVSSLPISVITTPNGGRYFDQRFPGLFDSVVVVPQLAGQSGKVGILSAKLQCLRVSPYERSIFLDGDLVCLRDPAFLLDGIVEDTVRIHGRLHTLETCENIMHHGISIRDFLSKLELDSYVHCSSAALAYDSVGGRRLADLLESERDHWMHRVRTECGDVLFDEVLIGLLGTRTRVDFFEHPKHAWQQLDMRFRWRGEHTMLHPGPMRNREAARTVGLVIRNRWKFGYAVPPALYWLSEIFKRRAEQAGKSRRQAWFLRMLIAHILDRDAKVPAR